MEWPKSVSGSLLSPPPLSCKEREVLHRLEVSSRRWTRSSVVGGARLGFRPRGRRDGVCRRVYVRDPGDVPDPGLDDEEE